MQTLWLLIASACGFLTLKLSFFSGNRSGASQVKTFEHLNATGTIPLVVFTVCIAVATLIAIFLYKNRKLQLRVIIIAIFLSLFNIFLYYRETQNFVEGNYDLTAILSLAIPFFLILAARGISKDQKLVKSLDRLR
jgi:hypothetical protein